MAENYKKTTLKQATLLVIILGLFVGGYWRLSKQHRSQPYSHQISVMGTYASVTFYEADDDVNEKAANTAFRVFHDINARFSNYNPSSELSKINEQAFEKPFTCSDEMWDMLTVCRQAYDVSHGAFDITAAPIVKLWGIYRGEKKQLPPDTEIQEALKRTGLDKVIFDDANKTIQFTVEGMRLDVGGIAKGYAVDKAVEAVRALGVKRGIIDLGGNLYCLEEPPPQRLTYNVGIRNPFKSAIDQPPGAVVSFRNMAIATSGNYERYVMIEGKRYAHIMDVRTGKPIQGMAGVSVISDRAVISDMLSTSIYINGGKYLEELHRQFPSIRVLIIRKPDNGTAEFTSFPEDSPFWKTLPPAPSWEQ